MSSRSVDRTKELRKAELRARLTAAQKAANQSTDAAIAYMIGMTANHLSQCVTKGRPLPREHDEALDEVIRTGKPARIAVRLDQRLQEMQASLEEVFANLGPHGKKRLYAEFEVWLAKIQGDLRRLDINVAHHGRTKANSSS